MAFRYHCSARADCELRLLPLPKESRGCCPRQRKWGNVLIRRQCLQVGVVCFVEFAKIGEQGTQGYQIF